MCEPATILAVSTLTSVASTAASAVGGYRTAREQERNALSAQQDANAGLVEQMHQTNQQATDQMVERSRAAMRDLGTINAVFADSGLSGNSQDRIATVTAGQAERDLTSIEANREARINQQSAEGAAIRARTQSAINSSPRPSILGAGLQIATSGLDYYSRTRGIK